ncbi:MAG: Thiol-disulfide isomerase and thioredoxin [Armatimonadetes bacterium]|nr:Thiol-disulfide isomerase and thioredoxin [Armatimonadota bacterium]
MRRRPIHRMMAIAAAALGMSLAAAWSAGAQAAPEAPAAQEAPAAGATGRVKVEAPDFPGGLKWLNSPPLKLEALRGKVVLVDFWEYTCVNCIRTFPYLKAWHEKYKDKGLVIIGIHTPEFHFAKEEPNVAKSAKQFGLTWPLIVDSDYVMWRTYGNQYWPAKYLIDQSGFVRDYHFGEGGYAATETLIQALLKEANPKVELPAITPALRGSDGPGAVCYPVTPELYLGSERGGHNGTLANREGYKLGKVVSYKDPGKWEDGMIYAHGPWKNTNEALISSRSGAKPQDYIGLKYHALEVNAVIRPENGKPVKVWISHDGKPVAKKDKGDDLRFDEQGRSYLLVDQPRMYNIIKNAEFGQRTLKLATGDAGMGLYAFTFVSCEVSKRAEK